MNEKQFGQSGIFNSANISKYEPHVSQFIKECYPHYGQFLDFIRSNDPIDSLNILPAQRREMYGTYQTWCRRKDMLSLNRHVFYNTIIYIGFRLHKAPDPGLADIAQTLSGSL